MVNVENFKKSSALDWIISHKLFNISGIYALLIVFLSFSLFIYHIFSAIFGQAEVHMFRSIPVTIGLILIFLLFPLKGRDQKFHTKFMIIDFVCISLATIVQIYTLANSRLIGEYTGVNPASLTIVIMGTILIVLILEATRRAINWIMVLIVIFFFVHSLFADHFPGFLFGPPTSYSLLVTHMFLGQDGIYSLPIAAMTTYIILFMYFGAFLSNVGVGESIRDIAISLTGKSVGGPAKVAVVASAVTGTISGSAVANTATTGAFTIPLMKSIGYKPAFAASVEAVASTGGLFMPPVMAAVAFIMAEFIGIKYSEIAKAAIIPAVIYFFSIFLMVHCEAVKLKLRGMDKVPNFGMVMKQKGLSVLPIIVITALILKGFTASLAAVGGIASIFIVSVMEKRKNFNILSNPLILFRFAEEGTKISVTLIAACASAGMIAGSIFASGVGGRFSDLIIMLGQENLIIALILAAVVSIILGMGITLTGVYILLAVLIAPAIVKLGVMPLAAHLFLIYFAGLSGLTPPVCLTAYTGAAIAGSDPMETGIQSFKLGIVAYILPFLFVFHPELLLVGQPIEIIRVTLLTIVLIFTIMLGIHGYFLTKISLTQRILLWVAGVILFISFKPLFAVIGVTLFGIFLLSHIFSLNRGGQPKNE